MEVEATLLFNQPTDRACRMWRDGVWRDGVWSNIAINMHVTNVTIVTW